MNLSRLLLIEWKKFSPNATFRAMAVLYAASFALILSLARLVGTNFKVTTNGQSYNPTADLFTYPKNWQLLAWIGSWPNMALLGFLGVFMITLEFSNKTLRQSVIFGLTRKEVVVAKLAWVVMLALATTVFYLVMGMVGVTTGGTGLSLPSAVGLSGFFLQAVGYLLLGTLAGLLIRQTALATLLYLSYVMFLESVARWIYYFAVAKSRALLFLPEQVLSALTPMPIPESVGSMTRGLGLPLSPLEASLMALLYAGLFAVVFSNRILKSDL